jgi:hypothetical protein
MPSQTTADRDQAHEEFLQLTSAVGVCISAWSSVEDRLSALFMMLHGRSAFHLTDPLRAAYEAVVSLEVRLAMIVATASADPVTRSIYAGHCGALGKKVMRSYKKRHEIAHFALVSRRRESGEAILIRPFYRAADYVANSGPELDARAVQERTARFEALRVRITTHIQHVAELKDLPAKYHAQAGDPFHDTQSLSVPI